MWLSKVREVWQGNGAYTDCSCDKCNKLPAVALTADCHGDAVTLCKDCWQKYFKEILFILDSPPPPEYVVCEGETDRGWKYQYMYNPQIAQQEMEKRRAKMENCT